jgi:hypothetical protein
MYVNVSSPQQVQQPGQFLRALLPLMCWSSAPVVGDLETLRKAVVAVVEVALRSSPGI